MTKLQRVLVVDASKVVRASLVRYLKGSFEICEDADGESAWQTLVLDSSIVAVISGCKLDKLDGVGLVERIRENRLQRINRLPFFLLISESFSDAERQSASLCGVSGFIPKGMGANELKDQLRHFVEQLPLLQNRRQDEAMPDVLSVVAPGVPAELEHDERALIGASDFMGNIGRLAGLSGVSQINVVPLKRVFLERTEIDKQLQLLLPSDHRPVQPLGLLVFALDGFATLASQYGDELAHRVAFKISSLLATKIRGEDYIGNLQPGRIVIIAPLTNIVLCTSFAGRVCKALAAARISLRGQRVGMTASVGIAAVPDDISVQSGEALLALANTRVEAAIQAGGNRVDSGERPLPPAAEKAEFPDRLSELLATIPPETMAANLGRAGLQIMPILKQIEQVLQLGLPLEELARRLGELAQGESSSR